jgi:hypothetical protein
VKELRRLRAPQSFASWEEDGLVVGEVCVEGVRQKKRSDVYSPQHAISDGLSIVNRLSAHGRQLADRFQLAAACSIGGNPGACCTCVNVDKSASEIDPRAAVRVELLDHSTD